MRIPRRVAVFALCAVGLAPQIANATPQAPAASTAAAVSAVPTDRRPVLRRVPLNQGVARPAERQGRQAPVPRSGTETPALESTASRELPTDTARLVGVGWDGSAPDQVELRSQSANGQWTSWIVAAKTDANDSTSPAAMNATTTQPIWVGDAIKVEVRGTRGGTDVSNELHALFVQSPTVAADSAVAGEASPTQTPPAGSATGTPMGSPTVVPTTSVPTTTAPASATAGASTSSPPATASSVPTATSGPSGGGPRRSGAGVEPAGPPSAVGAYLGVSTPVRVYSRAEWGADESMRTDGPEYSYGLRAAVIHHTDTTNAYAAGDVPAIIRSIYAYHVQANGWRDMGYNALVDRFGRVWEGRYGGLDLPVIGAHALGFNARTFGISMIGTFTDSAPPAATTEAVAQMIAWKFRITGILDPQGTAQLTTGSAGTLFPNGSVQVLPRIMGHRDVNSTTCPGGGAYALLPSVRQRVGALQAASPWGPGVPERLNPGSSVVSMNGQYRLTMQTDGNLVLSDVANNPLWSTGTSAPGSWLAVAADGNANLFDPSGHVRWTSAVLEPGSLLRVQDDGNVVLYTAEGRPRWDRLGLSGHRGFPIDPALSIWALDSGQSASSPNGRFRLTMRNDGNLVIAAADGTQRWSSSTNVPGAVLRTQPDGNVVIYDPKQAPLWAAAVSSPGAFMRLGDDGNLVLYATYLSPLWDSAGTTGHSAVTFGARPYLDRLGAGQMLRSASGSHLLAMQPDGNLVIYDSAGRPTWATMTFAAGSYVVTQGDGNLVIYRPNGTPAWTANVYSPGAYTVLQSDGNLVLYSSAGRAMWDSGGFTGHPAVRFP